MNGFTAADMSTAAANGFRDGLAAQPAAAQEAVAYRLEVQTEGVEPFTQYVTDHAFIATLRNAGCQVNATALYEAAPVAAAPTLDAELAQDRMSELCELERDVLDSLPAVYYMDPPDGGNVSLGEQVKRMAEDAALWRKHSSTPTTPGIDLGELAELLRIWLCNFDSGVRPDDDSKPEEATLWDRIERIRQQALDASPKGGNIPAPRIELTNGQIAQLADFAGTPVAGEPLDEQDVLVIQHADEGHSGSGLYAHYDDLPEEGAIYLDGQFPDSPKGGSTDENNDLLPELRDVEDYFTSVDPNPIHLATVRQAISFVTGLKATSAEVGE